jgi:hypothetical protein
MGLIRPFLSPRYPLLASHTLEVKDFGVVRKFLGFRVQLPSEYFTLDKETVLGEYLEAHSMANANPVLTPTALH